MIEIGNLPILALYSALGGRIDQRTLGRSEVYAACWGPHAHGIERYNMRLNNERGVWRCHCQGEGGGGKLDLVVLAGHARDRKEARAWLIEHGILGDGVAKEIPPALIRQLEPRSIPVIPGDPQRRPRDIPSHARLVSLYPYRSLSGGRVIKSRWQWIEGGEQRKTMRQYHHDGQRWCWGIPDGWRMQLYRQEMVQRTALDGGLVYLVEGERCADVLGAALEASGARDACATTVCNGKLLPEHLEIMHRARQVVVLADSDAPGRTRAAQHAKLLGSRFVDLYPDREDGSDIADWLADKPLSVLLLGNHAFSAV